jgi:hypothetical protein
LRVFVAPLCRQFQNPCNWKNKKSWAKKNVEKKKDILQIIDELKSKELEF